MIGAGGQAGQGDAANLLKPALARGELRTIAATTWSEYKKYFEKDAALARRFQVVKVEEPDEQQCMVMLRGIVTSLENHHNVRILDEDHEWCEEEQKCRSMIHRLEKLSNVVLRITRPSFVRARFLYTFATA